MCPNEANTGTIYLILQAAASVCTGALLGSCSRALEKGVQRGGDGEALLDPEQVAQLAQQRRDAQQRPGDADDAAAASSRHWACEQCAQPYARAAIEQQLVELVQRRATRYQLQDVRCVRCHRVATRLMAGACQCGGKLALDTPPGEFLAELDDEIVLEAFKRHDLAGQNTVKTGALGAIMRDLGADWDEDEVREIVASKIESLGFDVGFRFMERCAQSKLVGLAVSRVCSRRASLFSLHARARF